MSRRTLKRSRSGADEACPVCGKKLRGGKGLKAHGLAAHPDRPLDIAHAIAQRTALSGAAKGKAVQP